MIKIQDLKQEQCISIDQPLSWKINKEFYKYSLIYFGSTYIPNYLIS